MKAIAKETIRVNQLIRAEKVRLIGAEGVQLGIMTVPEALQAADEAGLDLVEVSPHSDPPVCRIMDYGKYKYQQKKRHQESKKSQTFIQMKEVRLRPRTDEHDLQVKVRHATKFLGAGNRVKVSVIFRGRELSHRELGIKMLNRFLEGTAEAGVVEGQPRFEGRMFTATLVPKVTSESK